jgi:hypothetical protein
MIFMYKILNEDFKVKLSFWASLLAPTSSLYLSPSICPVRTSDQSSVNLLLGVRRFKVSGVRQKRRMNEN